MRFRNWSLELKAGGLLITQLFKSSLRNKLGSLWTSHTHASAMCVEKGWRRLELKRKVTLKSSHYRRHLMESLTTKWSWSRICLEISFLLLPPLLLRRTHKLSLSMEKSLNSRLFAKSTRRDRKRSLTVVNSQRLSLPIVIFIQHWSVKPHSW